MSAFLDALRALQGDRDEGGRRWTFVAYDQLSDRIGPLAGAGPREAGIVLVESGWKPRLRPYHQQKLLYLLASQRHFALEQARRGVAVRYRFSERPYADVLEEESKEVGPLSMMEPAERELRVHLAPLVRSGTLRTRPHGGWLTTDEDFDESQDGPPWRMDAFYRAVRRRSGILMEEGRPAGGKFSFDAENREPWAGDPPAPEPPRFEVDPVTDEVAALVRRRYGRHPGRPDAGAVPASLEDVERLWSWALRECLPHFGPYEDAMSSRSRSLFHTRVSSPLNLHRLLPSRVVSDVATCPAPLASREGFIRQVLGWREFVRHVHRRTDGFRRIPGQEPGPVRDRPGDAGWGRWIRGAWRDEDGAEAGDRSRTPVDGGAAPSALGADMPLPPAWWGAESGLRCLDEVVAGVMEEGWSHHIPRLMVLSNLATLLDVSPRELADWFWVAYVDAFDWVVEPNVLGMGTWAVGDLMTTKPYVSGAPYIRRMGDFCGECRFDPATDCPITRLYWAFLDRHRDRLADNPRLRLPLAGLRRRPPGEREEDARTWTSVRETLGRGEPLRPGET